MKTVREAVLIALNNMEFSEAYSNLTLDQTLDQGTFSQQDRAFATVLFYGVLERRLTLDACVKRYSKIPMRKLSGDILNILRMGLYQLVWMDSVPDSAAVNESVRLVYAVKKVSAKGFVNAVLRGFVRDGKQIPLPKEKIARYEVEYSCPAWLVRKWIDEYSEDTAVELLKASVSTPPLYLRVNPLKTTPEELADLLTRRRRGTEVVKEIDNCLSVQGIGSIRHLPEYKKGMFHVQDLASQTLCKLLDPKPGERVFDLCAAPGGTSFTLAQRMEGKGELLAFDLYENRVELIRQGAERLGLCCITAQQGDASVFRPELGLADKVLCDVVCSGLGIIRRKPEIKYKDPADMKALPDLQYRILDTGANYVRPGGMLMYSTCTLSREENEQVSKRFLQEHPAFVPCALPGYDSFEHTFFPMECGSDGFYLAMFQRKE